MEELLRWRSKGARGVAASEEEGGQRKTGVGGGRAMEEDWSWRRKASEE